MNQQLLDFDELPLVLGFLDALQEGVWWRCVRWCKAVKPERQLPLDMASIEALAGLTTVAEGKALEVVLMRCFEANDKGYSRRPLASEAASIVAYRAAAAERQQAARERRKVLFAQARDAGLLMRCTATTQALEEALGLASHSANHSAVTVQSQHDHSVSHSASHSARERGPLVSPSLREVETRERASEAVVATRAAKACIAMRRAGMQTVNSAHPGLLRLLDAGVTDEELALAAAEAVAREKGFAYALGIVEGRRRDAASKGPVAPAVDLLAQWAPSVAAMRDAAAAEPWVAEG